MNHSKLERPYSIGEEIANSITHGIGLLLSVAALVIMLVFAALRGSAWHVVSVAIYGGSLVILYASSTFYHALQGPRVKSVFKHLDHSAIFLLIAGSYTPYLLVSLRGPWGWTLFGCVWGIAVLGILLENLLPRRLAALQLVLYVLMSWFVVIAGKPLLQGLATGGVVFLFVGGACYMSGIVFYLWKRLPYAHAIWHVFVLAGSIMHFFSIFLYVIPQRG